MTGRFFIIATVPDPGATCFCADSVPEQMMLMTLRPLQVDALIQLLNYRSFRQSSMSYLMLMLSIK